MKRVLNICLIALVFVSVVAGTYQLFFDSADAAWLKCGDDSKCTAYGAKCSVMSLKCWCNQILPGVGGYICSIAEPPPIE